jgi:NAD(P)-dependent dehydrogenase (short-subunit alcohol dehydrogenase family)
MRARSDGLLITITSVAGRAAPPGFGIYASSKLGLEALAEVLGYEVAGLGIDSVIVEPGPFPDTNLAAGQKDPEDSDVVAAYGEYGKFREIIQNNSRAAGLQNTAMLKSERVSDLVSDLIAMPKGARPVRTTVGMDFGLQDLNDTTRVFQQRFMAALGVGNVERTK